MWEPLRRVDDDPGFERNPAQAEMQKQFGLPPDDEIWLNDRYQVVVRYLKPTDPDLPVGREGMLHLSIHAHDRGPMRNWRHLQQIKNEVAGEERTALEIFPPESVLVDTSNEYHMWVLAVGVELPFTINQKLVSDDRQTEEYNRLSDEGLHKGRQEPWEEGLTTGRKDAGDPMLDENLRLLEERRDG